MLLMGSGAAPTKVGWAGGLATASHPGGCGREAGANDCEARTANRQTPGLPADSPVRAVWARNTTAGRGRVSKQVNLQPPIAETLPRDKHDDGLS